MIQVGVKLRINNAFQNLGKVAKVQNRSIIIRSNIGRGIFFRMGVITVCLKEAGKTASDRHLFTNVCQWLQCGPQGLQGGSQELQGRLLIEDRY